MPPNGRTNKIQRDECLLNFVNDNRDVSYYYVFPHNFRVYGSGALIVTVNCYEYKITLTHYVPFDAPSSIVLIPTYF